MPPRHSDRHERAIYDDDPYYDDDYYDRPRASRRVSRSAHDYGAAEAGRHRRRRYDSISPSPVRHSRARSEDHRSTHRPARGRYDSYDGYSDFSEDDRRHRGRRARSSRRRDSRVSSSRARGETSDKAHILQAAASAAVVAGATEAWRMRHEKTSWSRKGTKMATAAAGAAAIAAINNNNSGPKDQPGRTDALKATLGGLLVNRFASNARK
ncbi:hypothetical protein CCHL11_07259 [Colletotrichum chlorophyti]|uniref:Uncharacterized protein n=1 Tax=Colletotrichum chlorophyti TaxID=708187 RepID=A0A1Q8RXB5_9PEZI|nr:hypothetical protein CCHL11_07259 [Colletotrichum chlorophyti]